MGFRFDDTHVNEDEGRGEPRACPNCGESYRSRKEVENVDASRQAVCVAGTWAYIH